jgi:hypothetical protein
LKITDYRKIIKSQLRGFNQYTPIKEGDYAIVLDYPEKNFREREVVQAEKVVGDFVFVKKFNRSKTGWVHLNNLEKIKMVSTTSDPQDTRGMMPIKVEQVTTLRDLNPQLFKYFGQRIRKIFSDKMVTKEGEDYIPAINPKIVVGEFLSDMNAEGFVSKWGQDAGVVFVNAKAHFPIDEIVAHEFSHILSFYSQKLAQELKDPSIQLGITDEEMDEAGQIEKAEKEMQDWRQMGLDPHEIQKIKQENYFLQPAEVFAHTEQMVYLVHKFKNIDMQHVRLDETMTPDEKRAAIQEIESRPSNYYKRRVMSKLVPYMADKYKIKDFTARKIYESLFDNMENYVPNTPK